MTILAIPHAFTALAVGISGWMGLYALLQIAKIVRYGIFPGPFNPSQKIDENFDALVFSQCALLGAALFVLSFITFEHTNF